MSTGRASPPAPSAVLAALAPVALWRLAQLITARAGARWPGWSRSLTAAASALAVAGLVWPGWPGSEGEVRPTGAQELRSGGEDGRLQLAAWVRAQVGEDDLIIDCAGASLFQLLLPLRLQLLRAPSHTPSCQSWGRAPPSASGRLWFVTLEPAAGHDDRFGLPPAWMAAHGWQPWPLELEPLADGARLRVWSRERASEQP